MVVVVWFCGTVSTRWLHPTCPWHVCCMPNEGWLASLPRVAKKTLSETAKDRKSFSETVARLLCPLAHSHGDTLTQFLMNISLTHPQTPIHVKVCTCKFNERQWQKLRPRPLSVVFCGMKLTHMPWHIFICTCRHPRLLLCNLLLLLYPAAR